MRTVEDVALIVSKKVQDYFKDAENRKKFEEWYWKKYHKHYVWRK